MLSNNHYVGLVRWRDIGETPPEEQRPESKDLIAECKKIKKSGEFCSPAKPKDTKFAAFDLECTGNGGTLDGVHRCYAAGIAWLDDEGKQQYESFWNNE